MNRTNAEYPHLIKICGIRDPKTARECVRSGADAIGLVFFPKSPRHVTVQTARAIVQAVPDPVLKTGVFVDSPLDAIMETVHACGLTAVQLHGSESPDLVAVLKKAHLTVIKALFTTRAPLIDHAAMYKDADFLLVEYGKGILPGGNAETWDYMVPPAMKPGIPIILAGGLTPDTVGNVLLTSRVAGVDVSSGVESSPGKKDVHKIRRFIAAVRSLQQKV